jgi:pimeloyl-ACP methyl ester carboxylesterase
MDAASLTPQIEFVDVDWAGRPVRIEYQWIGCAEKEAPLLVFLHEGLGSLSSWKEFPQQLCAAAGCRGLVYSRPGYGRSTPRDEHEVWDPGYMHRQAYEVLPALLQALGVDMQAQPPWLVGHSDGGSIALLFAARYPARVSGMVLMAPHIMVEAVSVASIAKVRTAYLETDLRERLARHHDDPDSAFWGWNRIWLDPAFRAWSIEAELAVIGCPLLVAQGLDDEYGTLAQVHGIVARVPQARVLELPQCGHSPQRDQPEAISAAASAFIREHRRAVRERPA